MASSNLTPQSFIGNAGMNAANNQMLSDNLTDKIQAFFEQTKKEEERRIQQEEDLKLKVSCACVSVFHENKTERKKNEKL